MVRTGAIRSPCVGMLTGFWFHGLKAFFVITTLAGVTGLWPAVRADTGATVGDPECPAAAPLAADAFEISQQL